MAIEVKPNIATFIRRESSTMPPGDLPAAALAFANQLSALDVDVDYVTLRFDSQTKELGLTYSDSLKTALGLANNHYTLVPPPGTDGADSGGGGATSIAATGSLSVYIDPFNVNHEPLSLPLPEAYKRVIEVVAQAPGHDHVIVKVSAAGWESFYYACLGAGARFPDFAGTAVNVSQRFGFKTANVSPLLEITVIDAGAGAGVAPLLGWSGQYDQVYSAVLVMRFAAGTVPTEYR